MRTSFSKSQKSEKTRVFAFLASLFTPARMALIGAVIMAVRELLDSFKEEDDSEDGDN